LIHTNDVSREEKYANEQNAINQIRKMLPNHTGKEIYELWNEFEETKTEEAKYVTALDRLEGMIQVIEGGYEAIDIPELLGNYGNNIIKEVPELQPLFRIMKRKLKVLFEKAGHEWKKEYDI